MGEGIEQLVNVGERVQFVRTMGTGTPTVVFDPGLGDTADDWRGIQERVAAFTTALAYDRAGLGHSTPGLMPRTSGRMADELYALLHAAGIPGPYVLVGHSLGGLNAQLFAARYPDEVAGLVLVDSAFAKMPEWVEGLLTGEEWEANQRFWNEENAERANLLLSFEEARVTDWHTTIPLVVLSRARVFPNAEEQPSDWTDERERAYIESWQRYQRELAMRSTRGRFQVAEESGHYIQNSEPEVVVAAIREVIEAVR